MEQSEYDRLANALLTKADVNRYTKIPNNYGVAPDDAAHTALHPSGWTGVVAEWPHDDESLAVLAHEAGHAATTAELNNQGYGLMSLEWAASKWAMIALRRLKVDLTPEMHAIWKEGLDSYMAQPDLSASAIKDGTARTIVNYLLTKQD